MHDDHVTCQTLEAPKEHPHSHQGTLNPCTVEVNGVVVETVYAKDRTECYKMVCFGGANCTVYKSYFHSGSNLLEQFFDGTDRVNSDTCNL